MSGLFARRSAKGPRYVGLDEDDDDHENSMVAVMSPAQLVQSTRIYTMFPQMPRPMPLPSATAEELRHEIATRSSRLTGRSFHQDAYGRKYTHISTSNVSNTIHGVYLVVDVTDFPGLGEDDNDDNVPPAWDLLGTQPIPREWKSLQDLDVVQRTNEGQYTMGTNDPKPTFISGLIVRQLVREGVIPMQ